MTPTTLYVIEDHPVVREGIRMLLDASPGVHVIGTAASASGAVRELGALTRPPDVVLLDLDLGDEDGLEWLSRIQGAAPSARVLILTALRDAGRDEAAFRAGARGFVLKDASPEVLLRAVCEVAAGRLWFEARVLERSGRAPAGAPASGPLSTLTERERTLVALVAEGLHNEQIASRLGITEKTVRNQLTAVFDKIGVSGRLELIVFAHRHGLVRAAR